MRVKEYERLSGERVLPAIELEDGTVLREESATSSSGPECLLDRLPGPSIRPARSSAYRRGKEACRRAPCAHRGRDVVLEQQRDALTHGQDRRRCRRNTTRLGLGTSRPRVIAEQLRHRWRHPGG